MKRSNSRSSQLGRSNSIRSVSSQAQSNASASAAAAAAAALAASQRRASEQNAAAAGSSLQRSSSNASLRSNATGNLGSRPGQHHAVRLTGSKRLMQQQQQQQASSPALSTHGTFGRPGSVSGTRSKPPQVQQRRAPAMSSSASIRSFQSDLERINEDYNKTYTYTNQTSAGAMRTASASGNPGGASGFLAPPIVSTRGRRAESVASSALSDISDGAVDTAQLKKRASRVSFSDVDEQEDKRLSRDPSPSANVKRSALKASASGAAVPAGTGRGISPAAQLVRKVSSSSIGSAAGMMPPPAPIGASLVVASGGAAAPTGAGGLDAAKEEDELSTIQSHGSVYSDADEDFKASPVKQSVGRGNGSKTVTATSSAPVQQLKLTQQNLAAVTAASRNGGTGSRPASIAGSVGTGTPIKSAMRKAPSQNGSVRFNDEVTSHLDADSESEDSFAQRRRAKRIHGSNTGPGKMRTSLRGDGSVSGRSVTGSERNSVQRAPANASTGPQRMVSLRKNDRGGDRRQSMQEPAREPAPASNGLTRRMSMTSLRSQQPGPAARGGLVRRDSVAGSIAGSVHSEAVTQHIAVMEAAQRNVQRLLHKDASADVGALNSAGVHADAREPVKRSSFERKRSTHKLQRRDSVSSLMSMQERTFRTSMRPESVQDMPIGHRRAASDDRAFAKPAPRPEMQQSRSSMSIVPSRAETAPSTPKGFGRFRRMSFQFGSNKKPSKDQDVPPVPPFNLAMAGGRRYSSDSDAPRTPRAKKEAGALSTGTMRSPDRVQAAEASAAAGARKGSGSLGGKQRPGVQRLDSMVSVSQRTGKPKKFQKLRKLFGLKD